MTFHPELIYIQQGAEGFELASSILERLHDVPVEIVEDGPSLARRLADEGAPLEVQKRRLFLALRQGPFVKPFPQGRAPEADPVDFLLLEHGCPFDCHYCYLQHYLDHGVPTVFVNRERLAEDLAAMSGRPRRARLLAGEMGDPLALDPLTGTAQALIRASASHPEITFEIRTKSGHVNGLLEGIPSEGSGPSAVPDNMVPSWTLSPEEVWRRFEGLTASPEDRLAAASRCQKAGWRVGLRLDPVVRYTGWEEGYRSIVRMVGERLAPARIESWHLGIFRYTPGLESLARKRFPSCPLFLDESFPGPDGKLRYFKPLRVEMYRKIHAWILEVDPGARVRLIMETPAVRRGVFSYFG